MDIQNKIQLNEFKNVDAVNVDTTIKIDLDRNTDLNIEYDIQNVLDVTQVFDIERQDTKTYRIHGEFEYFSILNGILKNYTIVDDFFTLQPPSAIVKTIFTDLKIYLVKPSTTFTELIPNQRYIKNYDIISQVNNVELMNAAYAKNIFNEQQHSFIVNFDVEIGGVLDGLGFPLTEIGLYVEYQPQLNGLGTPETMKIKRYDSSGNSITQNFTPVPLNIGDTIVGDVITYDKLLFAQTNYNLLEQYIFTPYLDGATNRTLKWKYNPIIPIRLRYFEQEVRTGNSGSTSYQVVTSIPYFATPIDNEGNFVWRYLLDNGFFDPIDGVGVSFPFINQKHYVFNNIVFKVQPDLTDTNTANVFNQILFPDNGLDSSTPNSNLDRIGNICN